jgi:hypothetical protein
VPRDYPRLGCLPREVNAANELARGLEAVKILLAWLEANALRILSATP